MAIRRGNAFNNRFDGVGQEEDFFFGEGGNDALIGNGGDDRLFGDDGYDVLSGGSGNDELDGGSDADVLSGGSGDDKLVDSGFGSLFNADNDELYGESGNDYLNGGPGNDYLDGGTGNDTIDDRHGVDTIVGGAGNDDITVQGGDWFSFDNVDGGSGNDTIYIFGTKVRATAGADDDTITTDLAFDTYIRGGAGNDRFLVDVMADSGNVNYTVLYGGEFDSDFGIDTLDLSRLKGDVARSADGSFYEVGDGTITAKIDLLHGKLHIDIADQTFSGGSSGIGLPDLPGGALIVSTNAGLNGFENAIGSSGADEIIGSTGDNELSGGGGDDTIDGGVGKDYVDGGAGNDDLKGGSEDDVVNGGAGNDHIEGGSGSDTLVGGTGKDTILGGSGIDTIYGDGYRDAVGADTLTGGTGNDRFVFLEAAKTLILLKNTGSLVSVSITDTITDFDVSGSDHDQIDLFLILNEQALFGGSAQQAIDLGYIHFVQHGTLGDAGFGTKVMVDLNGGQTHTDAANNFAIADLQGVSENQLNASHFIV